MGPMKPVKLFATHTYRYLRDAICEADASFERGEVERRAFPDGERYLRVLAGADARSVEGRDVALVGGTIDDEETLELYDVACGLVQEGARALTIVVPYFGYSTMERAILAGEVVTAKTRARLLSAIPHAAEPNRVLLVDLHSEGVTHYFEGGARPAHLYAKPVVTELVTRLARGEDFVLACTDAGRAKWVESLANDLGVTASFVFKRRLDGSETRVTAVSAQVEGRRVIIYDDMIRTGSSLRGAAAAYRDAGARAISAVCTHGLFPGDALARLKDTGLFSAIACTDTHPRARSLAGDFLVVQSIAPLLSRKLSDMFAV